MGYIIENYIGYLILLPIGWFIGTLGIEFFKLARLWFDDKSMDVKEYFDGK